MVKEIHASESNENTKPMISQDEWTTQPMTFILFGATGDLAKRKLFPALYNLFLDGQLPHSISIIGLGRSIYADGDFQSKVEAALREFSRRPVQTNGLNEFLTAFRYCTFDATDSGSFDNLHDLIQRREKELAIPENRLFYLSVAPNLIDVITSGLKASGISATKGWKRLIVEKPFGVDLKSARQLNETLSNTFNDEEVYRIDHFLGKPIVQNLTSIVYSNPVFRSLLDPKQIANVQITAFETVGVETRAEYYDKAGAILDMAQNHLLQLVMMVALHLTEKVTAEEIREKKVKIMESLRPIAKEDVAHEVVRGQYEAGTIFGEPVIGYKEEPGVGVSSMNDTYFAARLSIDEPFWKGIPFYIRTGKRIASKSTKIVIEFKDQELDTVLTEGLNPNLLIVEISPHEGISLTVNMKNPSSKKFQPITLNFLTDLNHQPEAYELLLYDAIVGDSTFFANWKEVELSWQWIQPILEAFQEDTVPLFPYPSGSAGPQAASKLLQENQFKWW